VLRKLASGMGVSEDDQNKALNEEKKRSKKVVIISREELKIEISSLKN